MTSHQRVAAIGLAFLASTVLLPTTATAQERKAAPNPATLSVRAALVTEDLTIKPIPEASFRLIGRSDTVSFTTDLDGRATVRVSPGEWVAQSAQPIRSGGKQFVWAVPVTVPAGASTLELTSRNATVTTVADAAPPMAGAPGRRVSEEKRVYDAVRGGVFVVYGMTGRGTGFLVDSAGLVLTNGHVVAGTEAAQVRVQLDSATQVSGRIVALDKQRDVAVVAIHPVVAANRPVLALAAGPADSLTTEGERVLAIGSPLAQRSILTVGIVSKVEPRAIISDVNINHGNSGGPLLNLDGRVIGITTFGDSPEEHGEQGGPGVAGSIPITEASTVLALARDTVRSPSYQSPPALPLPVVPRVAFPIAPLQDAARVQNYNLKPYGYRAGGFLVTFLTPPLMAWWQGQMDKALTGRRREREARAGAQEGEKVDDLQNWYAWNEYVGQRVAAVVVQITPNIGETSGSFWGNVLAGGLSGGRYIGRSDYEFKADFRGLTVTRDGAPIEAAQRARVPAVLDFESWLASGKDFAYQGIYVFRMEDFAPDSAGQPPQIVLTIDDMKKPGQPLRLELKPRTSLAIWNDFAPYRAMLAAPSAGDSTQVAAPANPAPGRTARVSAENVKIFAGPNANSMVLATAPRGADLVLLTPATPHAEWLHVSFGGASGFVQAGSVEVR